MKNGTFLLLILFLLSACGGGGGGGSTPAAGPAPAPPPRTALNATITISWNANPDFEVSQNGGGYRVFYSDSPFTSGTEPGVTMIDNIANNVASQDINVTTSGNWYVRVQAVSARNTSGSPLSAQMTVSVPAS